MSEQYIFELQFQRRGKKEDRENQYVIIDGFSMADFHRLKEDLSLCMPEPFTILYIDDEEDIITIDSEDEFQEFAKIAKNRSCRGMLIRLILNASNTLSPSDNKKEVNMDNTLGEPVKAVSSGHINDHLVQNMQDILKLKDNIKTELKKEIMSELKLNEIGVHRLNTRVARGAGANLFGGPSTSKEAAQMVQCEEDAHYLPSPSEKKKYKLGHSALNSHKKLEKREKLLESKIDQRLEKLEMKKKKLWEKFNQKALDLRTMNATPQIVSVIATKESSEIAKAVSPSKTFSHTWTIVNDGTVPVGNYVELRHTWSTPGLEPKEAVLKCPPLLPGQIGTISVTFYAPRIQGISFISYWNFYNTCKEFGHYVSLTGKVKQIKQEEDKSAKGHKMMEEKHLRKKAIESVQEEIKARNEESQVILQQQIKQLKASLASSEIAAEMAEKAARLLARTTAAAESNTAAGAAGPCDANTLNGQELEEAAAGVQQLNLVDTGSDSDANAEGGEDTDRGFVMVNMASETKDGGKRKIREDEVTAPPADNLKEAKAQPEPVAFPKVNMRPNYPVYFPQSSHNPQPPLSLPVPPPAPSVFLRQTMMPPNVFHPVFPPTQARSDNIVVFPPPMNFGMGPVPVPLAPQPPFIPVSGPPTYILANQNQNDSRAFPQPQTENTPAEPAQNMTPTEDVAKSEQESNAGSVSTVAAEAEATRGLAAIIEDPADSTPSAPPQAVTSNQVQILPQVLVDGAINVAATAYSTARNAINNLRPKDESAEFDPVFENNMVMLMEMGFNNVERNARLLKRFNNDISQVIGVICATGGNNLDID